MNRRRGISSVLLGLSVAVQFGATKQPPAPEMPPCEMAAGDLQWAQRALEGWEHVSRDLLKLESAPLPWIVLFDASCAWHLAPARTLPGSTVPAATTFSFAGSSVPVRALRHQGSVRLPNNVEIAAEVKASTSMYRGGRAVFSVLALPSVWRAEPHYAKARDLETFLLGAFSHEMTHTRLLLDVNRRVRELAKTNDLPYPVNDDVIQAQFQRESGFARMVKAERDLFFRAALEPDPDRRRTLTASALASAGQRRLRYFSGSKAVYAELETLFLTMEGVGQWAAYRAGKAFGRSGPTDAERIDLVRDTKKAWSQEQGLAIFLLLDALVPDWQAQIFGGPAPASPLALLQQAITVSQ